MTGGERKQRKSLGRKEGYRLGGKVKDQGVRRRTRTRTGNKEERRENREVRKDLEDKSFAFRNNLKSLQHSHVWCL